MPYPNTTPSSNAQKLGQRKTNSTLSKSPSLVYNASRLARMVGGLGTSVMNNKSRDMKRNLQGSKSGQDLRVVQNQGRKLAQEREMLTTGSPDD